MRFLPIVIAFPLSVLLTAIAAAENIAERHETRIQFETRATRDVANDRMRATLFTEVEDATPARASSRVVRSVNEALRRLQKNNHLDVRTGTYQTYPVSDRGQITAWRARGELIVESGDVGEASTAVAAVSGTMQLAHVSFLVSPALRKDAQGELTAQAIAAFLDKGRDIAASFGATDFHVETASVIDDGGTPPVRPMMRAMSADASAPAPEFAPGTTAVSVTVTGTILLAR